MCENVIGSKKILLVYNIVNNLNNVPSLFANIVENK